VSENERIEVMLPDGLVSLHKYFIWANYMRTQFYKILEHNYKLTNRNSDDPNLQMVSEKYIFMSYWFAGLYVVIEGWRTLKLQDDKIEQLLKSPNVSLLKFFRNGVFHFQKKYSDSRFLNFIEKGFNNVEWVTNLHREFNRYFLQIADEI
jgi:hypothetical protein